MTRKEFEELVFDMLGVRADYPFEEDFETGVFRHTGAPGRVGRWFAIAMRNGINIFTALSPADITRARIWILDTLLRLQILLQTASGKRASLKRLKTIF